MRRLPAAVLAGSLLISGHSWSSDSPDCQLEIASIDYSGWSENLQANRIRHVFQHTEEYPYFRNVGPAFIGIETTRYFPHSIVPNRAYWTNVDGRKGVSAQGHYSLIEDIRGEATFDGVSVGVNLRDEFAFFLYDRSAKERSFYYAHTATKGLLDVMTTTPNGIEFIDVAKSNNWRIGSLASLRLRSARFNYREDHLGRHFEWDEGLYDSKYFRTLFFLDGKLVVAGVEYDQRKICRHPWSPLVVTNSNNLVPAIEAELRRRGEHVHVWKTAEDKKQAAAKKEAERTRWVQVLEFPRRHRGHFHLPGKNDVRIQFHDMRESKVTHSVGSWGHLIVNGIDLGKLVYTTVGHVGGLFGKEKKRREVKRKFDSGDFPTTIWNYFTEDRYTYDDNRYYECNGRTCSAHVRADKLTEVGWRF